MINLEKAEIKENKNLTHFTFLTNLVKILSVVYKKKKKKTLIIKGSVKYVFI